MNPRQQPRWWLLALGLVTLAWTGRGSAHPPAAPVPPTLEIEVLDPNVDPVGNPAVIRCAPDQIDIPPTVLVHKYYYTGDRTFQYKLLPGGPSIVVVNHPKTGERLYIPVMMLPGAPRVTYTDRAIVYDFGNQSIRVHFCCLTGRAEVQYSHSVLPMECKDKLKKMATNTKAWVERTGIPDARKKAIHSAKEAASSSADRIHEIGTTVITPFLQLGKLIPGINMLQSSPEDRAANLRNLQVQGAQEEKTLKAGFINTNR